MTYVVTQITSLAIRFVFFYSYLHFIEGERRWREGGPQNELGEKNGKNKIWTVNGNYYVDCGNKYFKQKKV